MNDVDARIMLLAGWLCLPRWQAAFRMASDRVRKVVGFHAGDVLQAAGTAPIEERSGILTGVAERVRSSDPVLSCAFEMLALRTTDDQAVIHAAVAGALGVLASADGDTHEARARLRVWDDLGRKFDPAAYGDDFFQIAEMYWRGEMRHSENDETHVSSGIPACIEILEQDRWDDALAWLIGETDRQVKRLGIETPNMLERDRKKLSATICEFADTLFAQGRPWTGELALAWQMLMCDPKRPASFAHLLAQVQWMLDNRAIVTNPDRLDNLRERIRIWWRGAEAEWTDSDVSAFRIAAVETSAGGTDVDDQGDLSSTPPRRMSKGVEQALAPEIKGPTVVVMPKALAEERGLPTAWRELRDEALPLVVCRNVARIRDALRAEYPHAWSAVSLLLQDLRDGRPVRMRPTLLLGPPGSGKSRLVRRLGELLDNLYVYRFDGAAAHDGTYAGSPKAWSNAQPSVPARAIMMSKIANPICMVDELERAGTATYNGNLWSAMTPFLERETAERYRETGLDVEMDLSHVNHVATGNSVDPLPAQLRDRYRIIGIPSPTLAHLPQLAGHVMRDLSIEDEARLHEEPLAGDELEVIGRAWTAQKFSMRKLQAIVRATLDARDNYAQRH
jgi:ATP-dependent Lon protease